MRQEGEKKEILNPRLVKEYVIAAHKSLAEVKELVEAEPGLVNATVNWGEGDWESGIGAAAHTGNREITLWLLEKGAHLDIYAAAMLGELAIVKAILAVQPNAVQAPGPHGIPLIHHAKMGGEQAEVVYNYLKTLI